MPIFCSIQPLLGRDITEVITALLGEEIGGRIAGVFRHTLETGERYVSPSFTERRQDLDVVEFYEWEAHRVTLPGGRRAVVCYFADTSERRALEISKAERAADLVRADRGKDDFLAMLAHKLRNPLAPLRSASEILRTPGATAEAAGLAVGILSRQIENMSEMIDDLLAVSRITEGKIELRPQVVAPEAVLNAAGSLARPGIEARGQEPPEVIVRVRDDAIGIAPSCCRASSIFSCKSGCGSDEGRVRARLAGFDEYLVKPADHDLLRTWLRNRA